MLYRYNIYAKLYMNVQFSEDLKGISKVWLVGDNFLAESFRWNFKKSTYQYYLKDHYEIIPYCSSQYSDRNMNALSRIVNSFIQGMNSKFYLPDFIIVFLDDDLIEYLGYKKVSLASLLGPWIKYLAQFMVDAVHQRWNDLPTKARLPAKTQIYMVESVNHDNFKYQNQQARSTFSKCLEVTAKLHDSMRVLKIKDFWDRLDDNLVMNNRFTKLGLH